MDDALLRSHVDAIYAMDRREFTTERDRRVRELRSAGHREEADALKRHRKPAVPAWAVNQLARRHPDRIDQLLRAGDRLRDAQRAATAGGHSIDLREASQQVRALVVELRGPAREILDAAGIRPDAHLDEVTQTLVTSAGAPDRYERLRRGVLEAPLPATGFEPLEAALVASDAAVADEAVSPADGDTAGPRREEVQRRAARRRDLERQAGQLRLSRERQARKVEAAEAKREQLRARLDAAAADEATQRAKLDRLDRELAAVTDELATLEG